SRRDSDRSSRANRGNRRGIRTSGNFTPAIFALGDSADEILTWSATGGKNFAARAENGRCWRIAAVRSGSVDRQQTSRDRTNRVERAPDHAVSKDHGVVAGGGDWPGTGGFSKS